ASRRPIPPGCASSRTRLARSAPPGSARRASCRRGARQPSSAYSRARRPAARGRACCEAPPARSSPRRWVIGRGRSGARRDEISRMRYLASGFWLFAGTMHFVIPRQYEAIVPSALGKWRKELVVASGAAEIAGGAMILAPRARRFGRWWLLATLAAVYP